MSMLAFRRFASNKSSEFIQNRNPRNLEKLCIGYRPAGYHLEKPGREYWHKLRVDCSSKHITASVVHFNGHVPVQASTKEWALRKFLYSGRDKSAYTNLGRVLGQRCLETGIEELACFIEPVEGSNMASLIQELEKSGVALKEPPRYVNPRPSDRERPEKPWLVDT